MSLTRLERVAPRPDGTALVLHGGAGGRIRELDAHAAAEFRAGLTRAHAAGEAVLDAGGSALDAVCAAVVVLEDDPLFNAGRGAALTLDGTAELDAAVMTGAGVGGAVAASRWARNPVLLARAVAERTPHVLLAAPAREVVAGLGLEVVEPEYFVTEARLRQIEAVRADPARAPRHGTVGAVARDRSGAVAAATSTGGISGQAVGRVGDTPILGAGTYARDGVAAVSCTGDGEAFLQGLVASDIAGRVRFAGASLPDAVEQTFAAEVEARGATGGLVALAGDGSGVLAFNSAMMFAAHRAGDEVVAWV